MNKTLNTLAIAAAACLTFGSSAQAGSMGYPRGYQERLSARDLDRTYTFTERRVIRQQPAVIGERRIVGQPRYVTRQESIPGRIVRTPFRAARTVARTPVIVGETLAGRRDLVNERGLFARDYDDRVLYRDDFRARPAARRLPARGFGYYDDGTWGRPAYRGGTFIDDGRW